MTMSFQRRHALRLAGCALAGQLPVRMAWAHSGHHAASAPVAPMARAELAVDLPDVQLMRADGKAMSLMQALNDGRPVVLNFIFTSCNAICPVASMGFVELRERLGPDRDRINMVSISIDPEQDTPRRLTTYAKQYSSAGTWTHLTGTVSASVDVQRAFGAWRGDKMNHQPLTFLRAAPGQKWVRLDGLAAPDLLAREVRSLMSGSVAMLR